MPNPPRPSCLDAHSPKPAFVLGLSYSDGRARITINEAIVAPYWGSPAEQDGEWILAQGDAIVVTWTNGRHRQVSIVHQDSAGVEYWHVISKFHGDVVRVWAEATPDAVITVAVGIAQQRKHEALRFFLSSFLEERREAIEAHAAAR